MTSNASGLAESFGAAGALAVRPGPDEADSPPPAAVPARPPAEERLAALLAERAAWVGRPVPPHPGPEAGEEGRAVVLVLIRGFDPAGLVAGARTFAAGLAPSEAQAWREAWTRTRFLFGNPANLAVRMPARAVSPDGAAGWVGPFPDGRVPGPARLLKPVAGELPVLPRAVACAAPADPWHTAPPEDPPAGRRDLHLAVRGLNLPEYLVHLHHTIAESVLRGSLLPHEPLRLIHQPDLGADLAAAEPGYARVAFGPGGSLRLYAWLAPAPPGADHREERDR